MPKINERNALRNNIVHFKTEKSHVSADIRLETVIFAGIMRCGLFSYIGCAAMLLLGYLPVWADGGKTELLDMSPVAILLSENGAIPIYSALAFLSAFHSIRLEVLLQRLLLLLNSDSCGETKIPEENRTKR